MTRNNNTPLLLGAGAIGLLVLAAAASPSGRRAAKQLEERVESFVTDWIPTLLRKTSQHEGDFWSVQENKDGNGVSYGILQWTQKSGSLGGLLRAMADADPSEFARIFGPSWRKVLDVTARASMEPVDGVALWAGDWVGRFEKAGRLPLFQEVQTRVAIASDYMSGAIEIARLLGVRSERAMTMYYNRTVHQGASGALGPAKRLVAWYAEDPARRPAEPKDVLAEDRKHERPPRVALAQPTPSGPASASPSWPAIHPLLVLRHLGGECAFVEAGGGVARVGPAVGGAFPVGVGFVRFQVVGGLATGQEQGQEHPPR